MPEKTMKCNKSIILLRLILPCLLVAVLLFPILAVPARAALIDYNDYITNVSVDGDNDLVTITIPADMAYFRITKKNADGEYKNAGDGFGSFDYKFETDVDYRIWYNPFSYIGDGLHGLDLTDIPIGTEITTRFGFNVDSWYMTDTPLLLCRYYYYEYKETPFLKQQIHKIGNSAEWDNLTDTYTIIDVKGANMLALTFEAQGFNFPSEYPAPLGIIAYDTVMTLKISSLLRLQQATGKTNQILKQVELQLAEQGKTLDDIRDQMEETNDKLDKLPGEIGDEMQGVIDKEEQEAESSGNKFVDQILGALPDPSTDVLAALKSLTDATAYTGTEAVLPIPAIVLPGIDGLFPETVIWEGTEFDFGEYLGFIPSSLLTLVQSLFTIAIVLFCVYELKGIISYCLTLRESKGG